MFFENRENYNNFLKNIEPNLKNLLEAIKDITNNGIVKNEDYVVGLHHVMSSPVQNQETQNPKDICDEILKNGFKKFYPNKPISDYFTCIGSVMSLNHNALNYQYGAQDDINYIAVFSIPKKFYNTDKSKMIETNYYQPRNKGDKIALDEFIYTIYSKFQNIPTNFFMGYYSYSKDGSVNFVRNPQFFSLLSQDDYEKFFEDTFALYTLSKPHMEKYNI